MAKGKLKKASQSSVAAKVRKAIGAGPNDEVEVVTPQFTRPNGALAGPAPKTKAEWTTLGRLGPDDLQALGCRRWGRRYEHSDGTESGAMLWLYPGEWYGSIPKGYAIVDINFKEQKFEPGVSDDDIRFGCLPYGFLQEDWS